jgi:hypothetical protein
VEFMVIKMALVQASPSTLSFPANNGSTNFLTFIKSSIIGAIDFKPLSVLTHQTRYTERDDLCLKLRNNYYKSHGRHISKLTCEIRTCKTEMIAATWQLNYLKRTRSFP